MSRVFPPPFLFEFIKIVKENLIQGGDIGPGSSIDSNDDNKYICWLDKWMKVRC